MTIRCDVIAFPLPSTTQRERLFGAAVAGNVALAHKVELHGRRVANVVETQARPYVNSEQNGNSTLSCT
jgi:hypothetical protein